MKVSYNWLREYVQSDASPQDIAEQLTMAGVAVDAVTPLNGGLAGAKTGRILAVEPHPNADKLLVCKVDVREETLTIVTGAPNVAPGQIVPVAVPGTVLPGGRRIEAVDFRGLPSQGMLLSPDEMNMDKKLVPAEMREGILILPDSAPIGADVVELLGLDDHILELDLTPNRSDCQSILGVAWDVAALSGAVPKQPATSELGRVVGATPGLEVEIRDRDLCGGYLALILDDVRIEQSPLWLQNKLRSVGVRPINNIVDLTNYVMLETGQPLHAFDYDRLVEHKIVVRRSLPGESLVTLDGEERVLPEGTLVIADAEVPVAIAGIMGGVHSEVGNGTTRVVIESAHFDLVSIRRSSRSLGLRTDASARFDKGIDPAGVYGAASRLALLVEELGCGRVLTPLVGDLPAYEEYKHIEVRYHRVNELLGVSLSGEEMADILVRLGFRVSPARENMIVSVPSRRRDISAEVDIVEEVGRVYGMHNIPTLPMSGELSRGSLTPPQAQRKHVRHQLAGLGLHEIFTLSFYDPEFANTLDLSPDHKWRQAVPLQNPLSRERSALRPSLIPGMLGVLQYNQARQASGMVCFEMAAAFTADQLPLRGKPQERLMLCLGGFGELQNNWVTASTMVDFFYLKGVVEAISKCAQFRPSSISYLHPGRQAEVLVGGRAAGFIGEMHPGLMSSLGLKERVVIAELDFHLACGSGLALPHFKGVSRFMAVDRDIAVVLEDGVAAADAVQVIRDAGGPALSKVTVFDVYQGENLPRGKRSLAFRLEFANLEATLTEAELTVAMQEIAGALESSLGAELRR
jgi:phenylalanyl-tRNA synthetase beta chain